ncbi:MAG: hydrogenase maturation protease [Bacteroidetes bacterium]|nr:hydrogenase maturation protease [Bacteroidota bacterium]
MAKLDVLVYGYGNPGRQDDGLGYAFIEAFENWIVKNRIKHIECRNSFQLNMEDAEIISTKKLVLFVDASNEEIADYCFSKVKHSDTEIGTSMHSVSPSLILDLCQQIYHKNPPTYLLHIKGYEWDFGDSLSRQAKDNLSRVLDQVQEIMIKENVDDIILKMNHLLEEKSCK